MNAAVLVLYSSIVSRSGAAAGDADVPPIIGLTLLGSGHPAFKAASVVISLPVWLCEYKGFWYTIPLAQL